MGNFTAKRLAIMLGLPFVGAATVIGTYLGNEVIVAAGWLSISAVAAVGSRPVVGVSLMTVGFLLAAYPTVLRSLGMLTINNLIGLVLLVLLGFRILATRDFEFLRVKQVQAFIFIGVMLFIGTLVAPWQFPYLKVSVGKMFVLDKTERLGQDFANRLAFLIFFIVFVRTRRDVKTMFVVFMLALYAAVPSALYNWGTGQLARGFRVSSSVTAGSNPNRLGMICLMEMALFWHWGKLRAGFIRQVVALTAMIGCLLVLMATGSRSAILGLGMLAILMQTGPKAFRVPAPQIGGIVLVGAIAVTTLVPRDAWERMIRFNPERGEVGASSSRMREETLERGWEMFADYPLFGVGLGNFREVARQVYLDDFYRPPHNSYLWAMSEGGIFVLLGYLWLFWVTWKDLQRIRALADRDPEILTWATGLRVVFLLFFFFSGFADLWLNPICYVLIGLIVTTKRYVESLPPATPAVAVRPPARRLEHAA
jgi:hypothetical protein